MTSFKNRAFFYAGFLLLLITSISRLGWAEEADGDRYAEVFRKTSYTSPLKQAAENIFVWPFELIRWPVTKTMVLVEKNDIPKKAEWGYEYMQDKGFTPRFLSGGFVSAGLDVDFVKVFGQRVNYPDLTLKGWVNYTHNVIFETGTKVGIDRIAGTGARAFNVFNYSQRPREHFYGLGPDTSKGDGTSYKMEDTLVETKIGYAPDPALAVDFIFSYDHVSITNGRDKGRGIIDPTFAPQTIPGLDGDDLLKFGTELTHDTRNHEEDSNHGGLDRLAFSFNEGLGNSEARYFNYQAETAHYLRLGSDRRTLALHAYGEHSDELHGHDVPFHQMARLGGYGSYPSLSHPLRSYDTNRFFGEGAILFNAEYRYTIYNYRDIKMDTVVFWDEGQVFRDYGKFQFGDFEASYGVGFRVAFLNHVMVSVEIAHGDEGTSFYVHNKAPF